MSDADLISFVRARLEYEDLTHFIRDKRVDNQCVRDATRPIVDEYERCSEYCEESNGEAAYGQKMGLEHSVRHLAGIWSDHPDWRDGWW